MKKLFLAATASLFTISCSKKEVSSQEEKISLEENVETIMTTMPEYNEEQIKELIKSKNNDTLYITNFFATWCGPCVREIPHFKKKMKELENEKVKFTYVSINKREDWTTDVNDFGAKQNLTEHIILFDTENISSDFFSDNFKVWTGESIPFTLITKGNKRDETIGMMNKYDLDAKIKSFK